MRTRTTLILFLVVCGVAAFVYFWEQHQRPWGQSLSGKNLLNVKQDEVESVEIRNAGGSVKIKKRSVDGRWFITEPFDDRLDPEILRRLLGLTEKSVIVEVLDVEKLKDGDRKVYGLDEESAIQVFYKRGGRSLARLKVGKPGLLGDVIYVEAPGDRDHPDIYLINSKSGPKEASLRDVLSLPLEQMRDPNLLPYKPADVVRFTVRQGGGEIDVQRQRLSDGGFTPWVLAKPLKVRGDQKRIDDFVGLFCSAKVQSLLPANAPPAGLDKPAAELVFLDHPDKKGSIIRLFANPATDAAAPTITGYLSERRAWFKIESEFLQAVPESPNALRSRTLADLDPARTTTIQIKSAIDTIEAYRAGRQWILKRSENDFIKASPERVAATIKALNSAEILEFVTDSLSNPADYGLDAPYLTVTFASAEHNFDRKAGKLELGRITPENSLVLRFGQGRDNKLYANYLGEPSVYLMAPDHFGLVEQHFIKWRDLQILEFGRPQIRRIKQTLGTEPPTELVAPPRSFKWTASRAGTDVTKLVDSRAVERIVAQAGSLQAADWATGLQEGHEAMKNPALELEFDVEYQEDVLAPPTTKTVRLTFAPAGGAAGALYYYGRCTDIAEYFLIKRDLFRELAQPVLDPARAAD